MALTSGHLANNGGIAGHSAGDFFPYTVMLQGTPDNLKHWVINPDGTKLKDYPTTALACEAAQFWFDWGFSFTSGELA